MSMINDSDKSTVELWNKVAESYNLEISETEEKLAIEIKDILNGLGINRQCSLIELGCGSGKLSAVLSREFDVTLLDISDKALEKSQQLFKKYGLKGEFIKGDLIDLNIEKQYDVMWNSGVMEHFNETDLLKAFQSMGKFQSKYYIFIVPNPLSIPYLMFRYKLMSKGDWIYGKEYLRFNYVEILKDAGFMIVDQCFIGKQMTKDQLRYALDSLDALNKFENILDQELLNKDNYCLTAYVAKLNVAKLKDDKQKNIEKYCQKTITDYITEVFDLNAKINNLMINKESELKYLKEISDKKEIEISELTTIIEKMEIERKKLNTLVSCKDEEIKKLEAQEAERLYALICRINLLEAEIENLIKEINNIRANEIDLTIVIKNKEEERNELQQQLQFAHNAINRTVSEIYKHNQTKFFRVLHAFRRFKYQFLNGSQVDKKDFLKWLNAKICGKTTSPDNRYNPLYQIIQMLDLNTVVSTVNADDHGFTGSREDGLISFSTQFEARQSYFKSFLKSSFVNETLKIKDIIKFKKYKGIIVYPSAVKWEPVQRPQQLLREFASRGYLCFFCEVADMDFSVVEIEENLILLNNEAFLLPILQNKTVIVLCTWLVQMAWAELLPHKVLWYDILDKIEFFSLYDDQMMEHHQKMVQEADIVSYSASELERYTNKRPGALLIENGVKVEDFRNDVVKRTPEDLKSLVNTNKPIIGYFGAIEEWFDMVLLEDLATNNPQWHFVLIGKPGIKTSQVYTNNIYFLGQKPYSELACYAQHFDVAIIPFVINDLTNCVSPVKFFEYVSLGLPVVSTPIKEMKRYENEFVFLAKDAKEFEEAIKLSLNDKVRVMAHTKNTELISKNTWANRVDKMEKVLETSERHWSIYSNFDYNEKIGIMSATFLDFNGNNFYTGGAERYLLDISKLLKEQGFTSVICQYGNYPWVRRFMDVDIVSLSRGNIKADDLSLETIEAFNRVFYQEMKNSSLFNVYSAFFEAFPMVAKPCIGISHGIAWDNPYCSANNGLTFWENNKKFIQGAKLCDKVVSVDTNTANWFQTIDYNVGRNMTVIPNYVDLSEFYPRDHYDVVEDKIVIIYPRRLYEARGLYLLLDIIDEILSKYPNIEIHFVGKGFDKDTKNVRKKQEKWKQRICWYSLDLEKMIEAYQRADIALVPTLYSEGTSLSCLEAMACGNAVIATRVGGLSDLVINDFNGLLIEPNSKALKEAIIELVENPHKLIEIKRRARTIAEAFSKEKWENKWVDVVENFKKENDIADPQGLKNNSKLVVIYLEQWSNETALIIGKLIVSILCNNHLIYIKTKRNNPNLKSFSFARLQWINWDEEDYACPDYVITEENLLDEIKHSVNHVLAKKGYTYESILKVIKEISDANIQPY